MRPINVVLAHHDAAAADRLTACLGKQFRNLAVAKSAGEIAPAVARLRAPFAVVDLELVDFAKLKSLCSEFPLNRLRVYSSFGGRSHVVRGPGRWARWIAAASSDLQGILLASERYVVLTRSRPVAA